jgi:cytosine/adenosine deaminase-related metal-dependent hydrolase
MILSNLILAAGSRAKPGSIVFKDGQIMEVTETQYPAGIDLGGALALPGLINSHDHLDFNLFPLLANRRYSNYHEWGRDIQVNNRDVIDAVLKIPESIRVQWGIYKNLLHGFTTVVNHGKQLSVRDPLIHVYQQSQSIHSLGFEERWCRQLLNIRQYRKRVAIHVGEGVDELAVAEIDTLIRANRLRRQLIGIHGVAMNTNQAKAFRALVWCPASNQNLFEKTAPIASLKNHTTILFGTDSTLTAPWDLCTHISTAFSMNALTATEMLEALTINAAAAWKIKDRGLLAEGKKADMIFVRKESAAEKEFLRSYQADDILLVIAEGRVVLFDEILSSQFFPKLVVMEAYTRIQTGKHVKFVYGNLSKLAEETHAYNATIPIPVNIA